MTVLRQDLVYALRQLRKSPGFTVLVVVTIALGIGANTAIFSLIGGFLRPLPVKRADQIVILAARTKGDETGFRFRFSFPALQEYRERASCFSDVFAFNTDVGGLSADGKTTEFLYLTVTGNYFTALGLRPAAGRLFLPGEGEKRDEELQIVLGYGYWQNRFGGGQVIGKQVRLNGHTARIIGVAPAEFHGTYAGADMQGYLPLTNYSTWPTRADVFTSREIRPLTMGARLKPGVAIATAQSAVDVLARRMETEHPATDKGITVRVLPETLARPMPLHFLADVLPTIRGLALSLAGLVLLLACMNVANILLIRATVREREMAIRVALGSGRRRLISQMLTESMLLAGMGAVAGLALGKLGSSVSASTIDIGTDLPVRLDFSFDWRVFLYALAAAVASGIFIGVWPAVRASRTSAGAVLHDGGRGSAGPGRQRVRALLVIGQVAGSLVLLVVAGLFARSLRNAQKVELGFNPDQMVHVRMDTVQAAYDRQRTINYYRELRRRVESIPGVESVTTSFSVPMGYISISSAVYPEGQPVTPGEQPLTIGTNPVDESYFTTMQIPIVRGRAFTDKDSETSTPVAIVNQTMAARLWPRQDPIGRRIRLKMPDAPTLQVIGVAHDSKYLAVYESPLPYLYVPITQMESSMRVLQVRSSVPPESLKMRLQKKVQALDPDIPLADMQTMRQGLSGPQGFLLFRIGALQAGEMGLLGLVLAMIGVYGVVAYGATQRTREIGIRMALGAQPQSILRMILRQGVVLVLAGVGAGLGALLLLSRVIAHVVMLVSATDPMTFVLVTALLTAAALWACYIPARRVMRVDPMIALRHE
jgi:macrolide transport system ATP-binding/permease protein